MIKKIQDYLPQLQEMFPNIHEKDIRRCVEYGWKMFYYYNLLGCDTIVIDQSRKLWFYCGNLYTDPISYFHYYRRKLQRKLQVLHRRKKLDWDGYYYTVVKKPKKNKKSNYTIENKFVFKLLEEAKLYYNIAKYFVRFKYPVDVGYKRFRNKMNIKDAEIVYVREHPTTFKDILYSTNDYKLE